MNDRPLSATEYEKLSVSTRERCDQLVLEIQERHAEIDALKTELGKKYDEYLCHRIEQREKQLGAPIAPQNRTVPVHEGVASSFDYEDNARRLRWM